MPKRAVPPLGELMVAHVAIAASKKGKVPRTAAEFSKAAFEHALPRVPKTWQSQWKQVVSSLDSTPGAESDWLPEERRTKFCREARRALKWSSEFARHDDYDVDLHAVLEADYFSDAPAEVSAMAAKILNVQNASRVVTRRQIEKAIQLLGNPTGDVLPRSVTTNLLSGLRVIGLAVALEEWAILQCDECELYFPRYGRYHLKRHHLFCSTKCRVRFHRSAAS